MRTIAMIAAACVLTVSLPDSADARRGKGAHKRQHHAAVKHPRSKKTYQRAPQRIMVAGILPVILPAQSSSIDDYLFEIYQRVPEKRDGTGDYTWKDPAAASRFGIDLRSYVIGGMDPDFKELVYHLCRAADAMNARCSINSAFRDDYRQHIAAGFKARVGWSRHGGSKAVGGYGHGQAVDIVSADNGDRFYTIIDRFIDDFGLTRPMKGIDPSHIQAIGDWRNIASRLREERLRPCSVAEAALSLPGC